MSAAKAGDVAAAQRALESGADPNCRVAGTWLNFTPLLQAISENHFEVAKLLLEHGADPYLEDENGDPAMVFAADKVNERIARFLTARGVSIDAKNREGLTALTRQISYAPSEDIDLLMRLGADPNQRGQRGETPVIMLAKVLSSSPKATQDRVAAMKVLINHGADVNAADEMGNFALLYAVENQTRAMVETLVNASANVNQQDQNGRTPLMLALLRRNKEGITDFLLGRGADLKMRDGNGATTLMFAIEGGDTKAAARLIKLGVDPQARTKDGFTAAHSAASFTGLGYRAAERAQDRRTAVELLRLISGAKGDLNAATEAGDTPLNLAVMSGYREAVEFLLAQGLNPNHANAKGETPLMHSITASVDRFAKMKLLVTKRAEVNAKSSEGLTALMLAAQTMQRGALIYLLGQGADANATDGRGATALRLLAANVRDGAVDSRDYPAMIQALARASSSVEQPDAEGMTPLIWAAISDLPEAVTPLLEKGADINARSNDGRTVLMWAASANAGKIVPLLIERGADVEAKDAQGRTAFEWARILELPVAQVMEAQSLKR